MNRPDCERPFVKKHKVILVATLDPRLSRGDLGVLMVILEHSGVNGSAFPGTVRIARFTKLSPRSVKRSVAKLAKAGYLTVRRRDCGKSNVYSVELGLAESAPCVTDAAGNLRAVGTQKSPPGDSCVLQPRDSVGLGGTSKLSPELSSEPSELTLGKTEAERAKKLIDPEREKIWLAEIHGLLATGSG